MAKRWKTSTGKVEGKIGRTKILKTGGDGSGFVKKEVGQWSGQRVRKKKGKLLSPWWKVEECVEMMVEESIRMALNFTNARLNEKTQKT